MKIVKRLFMNFPDIFIFFSVISKNFHTAVIFKCFNIHVLKSRTATAEYKFYPSSVSRLRDLHFCTPHFLFLELESAE